MPWRLTDRHCVQGRTSDLGEQVARGSPASACRARLASPDRFTNVPPRALEELEGKALMWPVRETYDPLMVYRCTGRGGGCCGPDGDCTARSRRTTYRVHGPEVSVATYLSTTTMK